MTAQTITRAASSAQIKYINDLLAEGQRYENLIAQHQHRTPVVADYKVSPSMTGASAQIASLKDIVARKRSQVKALGLTVQLPATVPAQPKQTITDGMWVIGDVANGGTCFKVQIAVHGSGRLYAKRLTADGTFVHAPGAIRDLIARGRKMTLEEAKFYGKLYGTCVRCGRTLTDENSISAGIGPICAEKF
jgi:Family of unknown function (DUF6011)